MRRRRRTRRRRTLRKARRSPATLDFVPGADGATVTHIDGTALVFGGDGYSQAIDIGAGSIKVKADGTYSFTADAGDGARCGSGRRRTR